MTHCSAPDFVPNIGARGRRRRAIFGAVWLVVGVIASWLLDRTRAPLMWYLALLLPFTMAGLGFFQAMEKT